MHPDQIIHRGAQRQHGVVTRRQLLDSGLSDRQIEWRLGTGALQRRHQGVYQVGPVAAPLAAEMAAALAGGPRATISHGSAVLVWGLTETRPDSVHVTSPTGARPQSGIIFHRRLLAADERQRRSGIPVTTVPRSLLDFAAIAAPRVLEQAVAEALARRLTTERQLKKLLERHTGARGARILRRLLAAGPALTRSRGEYDFLGVLRTTDLPKPEVNVRMGEYQLDYFWRSAGIAVELDSHEYHRFRFEYDRKRDAVLRMQGISVIRITYRQLEDEPVPTLVRLALLVGR